jgi:Fe-S-cluster containining protein
MMKNYLLFVAKVDDFCRRITSDYAEHMACRPGCDDCCRHLTLFPVEAAVLAYALRELPQLHADLIRRQASAATADGPCPLLVDRKCALYHARPLICRTHGLPVAIAVDNICRIDYCPKNFQDLDTIPGSSVLQLDRLNEALVTLNAIFVAGCGGNGNGRADRISIAEAVHMNVDHLEGKKI